MATSAPPQPPPERFFNFVNAYEQTEAMKAAIELEIFTAIAEGNVSAAMIAKRCEAAERGVEILCNCLTIHGFLTGTQYGLAPDSVFFLTRVRGHTLAAPLSFC
jgi:Dimerisation domain